MGGPHLSRRAFVTAAGAVLTAVAVPALAAETGGALQIWFIRHAESEINVPGNPRPVADGGMTYPLTRKGVEQAKALAEATADAPIVAVYTSTYLRAVQTADAVAFRHDLTLSLAPEAVEVDLGIKPGSPEDPRAV
jgi:probable phosphoglycerate mutase